MAQYKPTVETSRTGGKTASPRLRPIEERSASPHMQPQLSHTIAKKSLQPPKRYRKSKVRVDAFLGEWLNPEYYEQITPPPPSPLMVTTAKAELMSNESIDLFTPVAAPKASGGNLWGSARPASRESTLDDWSPIEEAMPPSPKSPTARRRASQSSVGGGIERPKSPFRPGSPLQPLTSTIPKQEFSMYRAPQPHYAVSSADSIPRGYFVHAKNACANVDYQWDSSRPPLDWGDGGELGEEWSSMHRRFRRGLNNLLQWYGQHDSDDRAEDSLSIEQAERRAVARTNAEEEQEDLVVILVTHGAGCNALIGALTGQPVLLDVGMASLTMAVRRDDAFENAVISGNGAASQPGRRTSHDLGLSSVYEMKLVASTEHLRPAATPPSLREPFTTHKLTTSFDSPPRKNTSSLLGSIRRPSVVPLSAPAGPDRSMSSPTGGHQDTPLSPGLWSPKVNTSSSEDRPAIFSANSDSAALLSTASDTSTLANGAQLTDARSGFTIAEQTAQPTSNPQGTEPAAALPQADSGMDRSDSTQSELGANGDLVPTSLSRGLSQKGLWGAQPKGTKVARTSRDSPKRRWTVNQD